MFLFQRSEPQASAKLIEKLVRIHVQIIIFKHYTVVWKECIWWSKNLSVSQLRCFVVFFVFFTYVIPVKRNRCLDIKHMMPIFPKDKKDKKTEEKESEQNDEHEEEEDGEKEEEEKGTATRATTRLASRLEAERYFDSSGTQRNRNNKL